MFLPAVICLLPILTAVLCGALRRGPEYAEIGTLEPQVPCPTRPGWDAGELLASSVCIVHDVLVTEVVAVEDDLVVAFAGGPGSWYLPADTRSDTLGVVRGVGWVEATIPLHVPWPVARRRAVDTLSRWRATGTALEAFISVQLGLTGLVNPATGEVFAAPLDASVTGRV